MSDNTELKEFFDPILELILKYENNQILNDNIIKYSFGLKNSVSNLILIKQIFPLC